jgi:large subunit ribosomal protein L25
MAEMTKVVAKKRDRAGKGGARSSRRDGLIPGVIYGDKQPPLMIAVEPKSVEREMHKEGFFNHRVQIDVDGTTVDALPRDVQVDPVTDKPLHLDFLRIGPDSIITVQVPVHFRNEAAAPGIKRGGVLNIVRHEVEFHCPANAIPEFITVDLTGADIGDSIHISAVTLPAGVKPVISDRDFTIATIAGSSAMKPEVEETVEAAAPEAAAPAAEEK